VGLTKGMRGVDKLVLWYYIDIRRSVKDLITPSSGAVHMVKKSNEVVAITPEYLNNLAELVKKIEEATGEPTESASGRKYDKIYRTENLGKKCDFMVERSSGNVYGTKSWVMINYRREFGSLDTISEWNWGGRRPSPIPGTPSAQAHAAREAGYIAKYGPRGRPRKVLTSS